MPYEWPENKNRFNVPYEYESSTNASNTVYRFYMHIKESQSTSTVGKVGLVFMPHISNLIQNPGEPYRRASCIASPFQQASLLEEFPRLLTVACVLYCIRGMHQWSCFLCDLAISSLWSLPSAHATTQLDSICISSCTLPERSNKRRSINTNIRAAMIDEGLLSTASDDDEEYRVRFRDRLIAKLGSVNVICFEEFKDQMNLVRMLCLHMFHYCIAQWLKRSRTCTLCRCQQIIF